MKELFYSNGIDIFGPVDIEEFSVNRYYKSTLIWYEGLTGWINIGDCDELRHLIGTMSTPALDNVLPQSSPDLTPPLSKKDHFKMSRVRKYSVAATLLGVLLVVLLMVYLKENKSNQESIVPVSPPAIDSTTLKQAALFEKTEQEAEMKTYRINWEKFITAVPNDFKKGNIGGIHDLKVIVKNNSPYKIDSMKVKVTYLKANGDSYHTEVMRFDNVDSLASKELFAPNSDRGVKVSCSILSVTSGAMNLCFNKKSEKLNAVKGEDDCKCN